ncbi:MAG: hypothetical protein LBS76_01045 [Mycoplasmataceae bacterium]|nr:hypothetical protein [Mycoplasmataceae bacterium]
MSNDTNNKDNPNRFYILSSIWSASLSLLGLVIGIILGLSAHLFDVTFAFMIGLGFPTLSVYLTKKITDLVLGLAKKGIKKSQIIFVSMVLFILKYIVVVIPLIVGLIVNACTKTLIFSPYVLVVTALIYPMTSLIVQWYFVKKQKKGTK